VFLFFLVLWENRGVIKGFLCRQPAFFKWGGGGGGGECYVDFLNAESFSRTDN